MTAYKRGMCYFVVNGQRIAFFVTMMFILCLWISKDKSVLLFGLQKIMLSPQTSVKQSLADLHQQVNHLRQWPSRC